MPGIRIVTDSSCDLPHQLEVEHGIEIVPLSIRFGSDTLVDRVELTVDDFWTRVQRAPELPETAAPSAGAFEERFRRLADEGADGIVCVNISSKLSATYQSARIAAQAVEGTIPVRVVDTRSVSMGLGLVTLGAAEAAALGKGLDDVAGVAHELTERVKVVAALDTLDHLKRGGRIGAAQAMIGSLLSFKPIIEVRGGEVEPASRQRTRQRSLAYLLDRLRSEPSIERLSVVHGQAPDLDPFLDQVGAIVPRDQIVIAQLGPVVGTHAGPGVMGIAYLPAER